MIWLDWFIPLFGYLQQILLASTLRPIRLCDDTHSDLHKVFLLTPA